MYFTFILIMGSIATILGVILVFFDHYLASYGIKKINEDINFTIAGGKHLSLYLHFRKLKEKQSADLRRRKSRMTRMDE